MILNLRGLNEYVEYKYFKMDFIWNVISLMKLYCYMVFVDFKDVYYLVCICLEYQKYLKFFWNGILYKFICFFNGLVLVFRKFIKLLKFVYLLLRKKGYILLFYIDDFILMGDNFYECVLNVVDIVKVLDNLNFVIYFEKFVFLLI